MQDFVGEMTKQLLPFFVAVIIILLIILIFKSFISRAKNSSLLKNPRKKSAKNYAEKSFMTKSEFAFYEKLKKLETTGKVIVAPQVNLATIIRRTDDGAHYQNELYRNIDFAIFSRNYEKVLLLVELNDATHQQRSRIARDRKVRDICESAGIKLIRFYTDKPNTENYVLSRIIKEIKEAQ